MITSGNSAGWDLWRSLVQLQRFTVPRLDEAVQGLPSPAALRKTSLLVLPGLLPQHSTAPTRKNMVRIYFAATTLPGQCLALAAEV